MNAITHRRLLHEAGAAIEAINAWLEHLFTQADELDEIDGYQEEAEARRQYAEEIWSIINGTAQVLIASELHSLAVNDDAWCGCDPQA